jgi:signal transduction histidine kinase
VRSAADAPPKVVRYLGLIRDEAARLAGLVSSLLKLAGVSKAPLCLQYTDLTAVAQQAVETLRLQAEEGRLPAIEVEALPRVDVDAPLFQQVFVNLLSNAVKFTRDVPTPRVRVRASAQGQDVVIEVSDNGAGFSAQSAASLFQPFQRLHGGAYEGTGLGLTIVRRIVERHGGRVWAEGRVGSGAVFFIALPSAPRRSG